MLRDGITGSRVGSMVGISSLAHCQAQGLAIAFGVWKLSRVIPNLSDWQALFGSILVSQRLEIGCRPHLFKSELMRHSILNVVQILEHE